jgi:hypothetical protein
MSTIIKDTKQYYLRPSGGLKNNGTSCSDILFNINGLLRDDSNILYNTISVIHAEIPYSFYVINEYNNLLSLSTGNIYVDYGNYNANTLMKFINAKLPTNMVLSFNSTTGKMTLTYTQPFQIYSSSTIYNVLGFAKTNYSSTTNKIDFPYPFNSLGTKNLYIKSNVLLSNYNSATKDYVTLTSIPVNVEPYSIILYNNYSTSSHLIKNTILDEIEIKIYDDNNSLVDFNNIEWSITIEICSFVEVTFSNITLNKYLANNI